MKLSKHLTIDEERRELIDHKLNQTHPLSFAELAILTLLLQEHGGVVDKQTLTDAGWPGRVVAQSSLTQCVSTLRRKLAGHPEVELKTIPRYGYSLCCTQAAPAEVAPSSEPRRPQLNEAQPGRARPRWRWLTLPAVLILVAFLHLSGTLTQITDWVLLMNQPGVAEIEPDRMRVGSHPNQVHRVVFEDETAVEQVSPQQFIANWRRADEMLPEVRPQQSYLKQSADFDSIALCADYDGQCRDRQPLNLVRRHDQQPPLDLKWLQETKLRMEQVTYNKILLDRFDGPTEGMLEDVYRADVYYYGDSDNVVRGDLRFSVLYQSDNHGQLLVAACFTDAVNKEISMRYEFSGPFRVQQRTVDGKAVKRFLIDVDNQNFRRPEQLSEEGAVIYREIQRAVLSKKQMTLHQLYEDDQSGVWSLPLWGETVVWAHRAKLTL
ncbi:winged helix-turn-helix domain-containing protein [Ferrimonas sp. SCSIO 43195]|uniref:winged helix-turn-helix domain-containing protein n=1 Tax=Ferrimonas sp. SCSIO 43195 TaxID=2822844 RepID=UPI002075F47E|nr:winged helix-turn-helix domain-containing protein [Ferrimonas sp. SCSIO 43195]USD37169.1 winged helix-turn-helix domain-containing protein [Ferrimonas sp. SCSIO 43195]